MKLEINSFGTNGYYNEFLFIIYHYKKVVNKPKYKIHKLTSSVLYYFFISLIFLCISLMLFISSFITV